MVLDQGRTENNRNAVIARIGAEALEFLNRTFPLQAGLGKSIIAGPDTEASDGLDALPLLASARARAQGCTCPDPKPGQGTPENPRQVNMECHLHGLLWLFKEGKGEGS